MRPRLLGFAVSGLITCSLGAARAEDLRVHGTLAGAKAVGGFQGSELSFGGAAFAAVELPFLPIFGAELQLGTVVLAKGSAPSDPAIVPGDGAHALIGSFGVRVHPFRKEDNTDISSLTGLWGATHLGATSTGGLFRGEFDVQAGYDFLISEGHFGIGPTLGFVHVFQPDTEFRPENANILTLGVHGMLDTAPRLPKDRDKDGIIDREDRCPDDPEDKDDFEDADGCPESDNDKDGVIDEDDKCPLEPEDKDGFEDEDGCPELDNDKDGIPDAKDKCPLEPEDKDNFEDEDGCPELDNDKDGIPDKEDLCPLEPETDNDYADDDGCPDDESIRVVGERIVLDDRVHFAENTAVIRQISFPLLERLGRLLKEHPEYIHIEVQGHTDQRGPADFNEKLARDRAASVLEFLVKQGVPRDRLSSVGFAATRVLTTERNARALFLNRRVEFVITRNVEKKMGSEPGAEAPKPETVPGTPPTTPPPPGVTPPKEAAPEPAKKVPGTGLSDEKEAP
jgi:outer membrane protein OmpA-like peptidoglycan-associated protein